MRRLPVVLVALVAFALVFPTGPSLAGRATTRQETIQYIGPNAAVSSPNLWAVLAKAECQDTGVSCLRLDSKRGERYMSLQIDDAVPGSTFVQVDQIVADSVEFCGRAKKRIPILGGYPVYVWLMSGTCFESTEPSIVTTGSITATFETR